MLFENTLPVAAGYFQCDISRNRPPKDKDRQAALLYMTSGEGVWTLGSWKFPVRRGDMFAIPIKMHASAELNMSRPLGYYFCYFELTPGQENSTALQWPWDLGITVAAPSATTPPVASGPFRPELAAYFRTMQYELSRGNVNAQLAARAQLTLLGINFGRMLALSGALANRAAATQKAQRMGRELPEPVARVVDFVMSHLDKDISLAELANVAQCSERRFVDIFREAMDVSPMAYVRERRVREAQRLLIQGLAVKDVASRLNFADSHHFSRVFRQATGISPSEYAAGKAPVRQRASGEFSSAPPRAAGA